MQLSGEQVTPERGRKSGVVLPGFVSSVCSRPGQASQFDWPRWGLGVWYAVGLEYWGGCAGEMTCAKNLDNKWLALIDSWTKPNQSGTLRALAIAGKGQITVPISQDKPPIYTTLVQPIMMASNVD
ncbi:hypothetical protein RRG08_062437 [Elysia crispata]|uniref:Uncharacterized protein n=1 Tax=Elysia crispata TaxID=231223 RepID=A0AAE0XNI4_9GAST|nr:hypothetical protein RRG08_062437 [Elysia crispata]